MIANLPARVLTLLVTPPAIPITREIPRSLRAETMPGLVAQGRAQGHLAASLVDLLDRRITAYLAAVGQAAKGTRNATAYKVCRWLVNDFGCSEEVAWAYARDWNKGNTPPLTERELTLTFRSAQRSGSRPAGCAHTARGAA